MEGCSLPITTAGIVGTLRSALANTRRIRSITSAGSGDFRLDLGDVIAPVAVIIDDHIIIQNGAKGIAQHLHAKIYNMSDAT